MRKLLQVTLLVLASVSTMPRQASAQDFSCGSNSVIVGFSGKVGAWIDHFYPICGVVQGNAVTSEHNGPTFGTSDGGTFQSAHCAPNEAVRGIKYGFAHPDDNMYAQNLSASCAPVTLPSMPDSTIELYSDNGAASGHYTGVSPPQICQGNQIATGLHVVPAGGSVYTIDLLCGDVPVSNVHSAVTPRWAGKSLGRQNNKQQGSPLETPDQARRNKTVFPH
jgi:hypothetical protein